MKNSTINPIEHPRAAKRMATKTTSRRKTSKARNLDRQHSGPTNNLTVDREQALQRLLELLAIPGGSGHEKQVADYIIDQLRAAGAPESAIRFDNAHRKSPFGGEVGNLILQLPGT